MTRISFFVSKEHYLNLASLALSDQLGSKIPIKMDGDKVGYLVLEDTQEADNGYWLFGEIVDHAVI